MKIEILEPTLKQAFILICAFNLATRVQMEMKPKAKFIRFENKAMWYLLNEHVLNTYHTA